MKRPAKIVGFSVGKESVTYEIVYEYSDYSSKRIIAKVSQEDALDKDIVAKTAERNIASLPKDDPFCKTLAKKMMDQSLELEVPE